MSGNYKSFLVVNPHSSGGRTGRLWEEIKNAVQEEIGDFEFAFTKATGHAIELSRSALKKGFEMIVSIGGDGTNNEVVNGFFENGKKINPTAVFGLVCSGTGSDFIRTAGVPKNFKEAVKHLSGKAFKEIDLGWMTHKSHSGGMVERYFINIASFGVGGEVDALVNKSKKRFGGKMAFLSASFRAGLFYKNRVVRLRLDNKQELERKVFNLAIANGCYFGAGMCVAPMAKLNDGIFEVVILGHLNFLERLKLSRLIYEGKHLEMAKVEHFQAQEVYAESKENVLLDVDGEQPGSLPAEFRALNSGIRLKVKER